MARKVGLSLADVVDAAAAIADTEGLEAVTLLSVATRLDVRSPSLYTHVQGLSGLRRALALFAAQTMAAELREGSDGAAGREAIREMADAYRRFAHAHPGLYAAVQRAADPTEDREMYDALLLVIAPVLDALAGAGVRRRAEQIHLTRALRSALHGFVALEQLGGFGLPEDIDESFTRLVELILAGVGRPT